jgi:hypothetical protein
VSGGLMSYGADVRVPPRGRLRRVILQREKPADLLVQAPNKYALVLNLKWGRRCLVQRYSAPRSTLGLIGQ